MIGIVLALTIVLTIPLTAIAQHDQHGAAGEKLGTAHFETSCSPATRADFDRDRCGSVLDIAKESDSPRAELQRARSFLQRP